MKKIFLMFMLISATFTLLSANNFYIKVMSVVHTKDLSSVQHNLNNLGYEMHLTKYKYWDRVYAGPFRDQDEAYRALVKIRKHISKGAFVSTLSVLPMSDDNTISNVVQPMQTKQVEAPSDEPVEKVAATKETEPVKVADVDDTKKEIQTIQMEKSDSSTMATISKEELVEPSIYNSEDTTIISESKNDNDFFIGLSGGGSYLTINKDTINYGVPLNFKLRDPGFNYGAEAGYNFNKNIFMTMSYQRTHVENIYFDNAFATLNYKFNEIFSIYPYMGILAGYGIMNWKDNPTTSITTTDTTTDTSSSFLGGVQVGSETPIYSDISIYVFYRYLMVNYVNYIKTTTTETELKHSGEHNLNVGLKYNF